MSHHYRFLSNKFCSSSLCSLAFAEQKSYDYPTSGLTLNDGYLFDAVRTLQALKLNQIVQACLCHTRSIFICFDLHAAKLEDIVLFEMNSETASYYTWYHHESSGTVNKNNGYEAGKTYTWYLEGTPAVPMSIQVGI